MLPDNTWKFKEIIFCVFAIVFVLFVHGAIPFLMLPTLGQAIWTTGFSQSMTNGSLFDFYAHDFGIPKPAAIAFGLAGAWPTSLLIRLGLHAADAYTAMIALWLGLAMFSAYRLTLRFGGTKFTALSGATIWMTMPIIWTHAGYSMLSLGIALLSFFFLAAIKLFLIETTETSRIDSASMALYAIATIISVFMDGYTFIMFAIGSSILFTYNFTTQPNIRSKLIKIALPVHVFSFALAYALYGLYVGKINFESHQIDFFRGWGLDLSFLIIPTKGVLWLPDLLGLSIERSNEIYFGDSSVWENTFALPTIIFGIFSWIFTRNKAKISTGILLISFFGFYMALGPSLKINSIKPEILQQNHPREKSALMEHEYAVAPTGSAWVSEKIPGFNVMRASYRWSALGLFSLWLLIAIWIAKVRKKSEKILVSLLFFLFLLNLPIHEKSWRGGIDNRIMFQQIEQELIATLDQKIRSQEIVAFLPWQNDFIVNYLAPKIGFRTFNIGGDKNLSIAQTDWPQKMLSLGGELDSGKAVSSLSILFDGAADSIVFPYFHTLWSPHLWPCVEKTTARLNDEMRKHIHNIPGFICPHERKDKLQPVISTLRTLPYIDVVETDLFAIVRLRPEFKNSKNQRGSLDRIFENIQYPVLISSDSLEAPYLLRNGWHTLETNHVWSQSNADLRLPIPKYCKIKTCKAKLVFETFNASVHRPVDVFFTSDDQEWKWSEKMTVTSSHPVSVYVPLIGAAAAADLRNINISIPGATSPQKLTGSPDDRALGISLQRIEIVTS
jgi:hypothetical protein